MAVGGSAVILDTTDLLNPIDTLVVQGTIDMEASVVEIDGFQKTTAPKLYECILSNKGNDPSYLGTFTSVPGMLYEKSDTAIPQVKMAYNPKTGEYVLLTLDASQKYVSTDGANWTVEATHLHPTANMTQIRVLGFVCNNYVTINAGGAYYVYLMFVNSTNGTVVRRLYSVINNTWATMYGYNVNPTLAISEYYYGALMVPTDGSAMYISGPYLSPDGSNKHQMIKIALTSTTNTGTYTLVLNVQGDGVTCLYPRSMAFNGTKYVGVGLNSTFTSSNDWTNWSMTTNVFSFTAAGIMWTNGSYLVCSANSYDYAYSADGETWNTAVVSVPPMIDFSSALGYGVLGNYAMWAFQRSDGIIQIIFRLSPTNMSYLEYRPDSTASLNNVYDIQNMLIVDSKFLLQDLSDMKILSVYSTNTAMQQWNPYWQEYDTTDVGEYIYSTASFMPRNYYRPDGSTWTKATNPELWSYAQNYTSVQPAGTIDKTAFINTATTIFKLPNLYNATTNPYIWLKMKTGSNHSLYACDTQNTNQDPATDPTINSGLVDNYVLEACPCPTSNTQGVLVFWNGLFIFASGTSSSARIDTSPDGVTWTNRALYTMNGNERFGVEAHSSSLIMFATTDYDSSKYWTSSDGLSWVQRVLPIVANRPGLAWGNGYFLVTHGTSCYTSTDGVTWTARTAQGFEYHQKACVYMSNVNRFLIFAHGTPYIYWTSDFVIFTRINAPFTMYINQYNVASYNDILGICFLKTYFSPTTYATSSDGITWATRNFPSFVTSANMYANNITWVNTRCVLAFTYGYAPHNPCFMYSDDLINWTTIFTNSTIGQWDALWSAYGNSMLLFAQFQPTKMWKATATYSSIIYSPYWTKLRTHPIGDIMHLSGKDVIPPKGYVRADGGTYNRSTYSPLWSWCQMHTKVGTGATQYGTGNGTSTFTTPNYGPGVFICAE